MHLKRERLVGYLSMMYASFYVDVDITPAMFVYICVYVIVFSLMFLMVTI